MFRISQEQKGKFQDLEDQKAVTRIAAYLRKNEPADMEPMSDAEVKELANASYARGRRLGLRRLNSLCLFAFLVRETGGEALTAHEVEEAMTEPGADPHHVLNQTIEIIKIASQAEAGAGG